MKPHQVFVQTLSEHKLHVFVIIAISLFDRFSPQPEAAIKWTVYLAASTIMAIVFGLTTLCGLAVLAATVFFRPWETIEETFAGLLADSLRLLSWVSIHMLLPLTLIRIFADSLYLAYQQHPETLLGYFVGFVFCSFVMLAGGIQFVVRHLSGSFVVTREIAHGSAKKAAVASTGEFDVILKQIAVHRKNIAAHEAGHVLAYAAVEPLPASLQLRIWPGGGQVESRGIGLNTSQAVYEWLMYIDVAGCVAEIMLTGKHVYGASEDLAKWQARARTYLEHQYAGHYFVEPGNDQEFDHNWQVMANLMVKHFTYMHDFLSMNKNVLRELAALAEEKGTLNRDELRPFLARVILPDDFPRLGPEDFVVGDKSKANR